MILELCNYRMKTNSLRMNKDKNRNKNKRNNHFSNYTS